jgi:membrane protein
LKQRWRFAGRDRVPAFRPTPRVVWSLLGETFSEWNTDRAPRLGAALAYYTVFALAPGLLLITALAGLLLGQEAAQAQIIGQVEELVGFSGAQAVQAVIESARNAGGTLAATSFGLVTLLFALWGVFGELQDALNTIWGVTTRPFRGVIGAIKARFWSVAMAVGIGFLLLVSLAASTWLAALGKFFARDLPLPVGLMETGNALLSFAIITCLFAMIYKLLPDVKVAWRDVWIGAAVTAFLFTLGKSLIGLYLGRSAVASVYGAAGSLIVILLWVYYSAQIVFFGAEFTKVYSRRYGAVVVLDTAAMPLTAAARAARGMGRRRQRASGVELVRHEPKVLIGPWSTRRTPRRTLDSGCDE